MWQQMVCELASATRDGRYEWEIVASDKKLLSLLTEVVGPSRQGN